MKNRYVVTIVLKSRKSLRTAQMMITQTCADWHGDIDEKRSFVAKGPCPLVHVVPDSSARNRLYVVYASCSRCNGWAAVVRANSKADANRIMSESDWLENGRVSAHETQTFEEHNENMSESDEEIATYEKLKYGKWIELDWRT